MKKLVFINVCIRKEASRTKKLAMPLLEELSKRYEITEIDLTDTTLKPINNSEYTKRGLEGLSQEDLKNGRLVSEADRIVIATPFWDMSIPSVLKTFIERISAPDLTFVSNPDGTTRGNCRADGLLYITTRGMEIETNSELDQGSSYLKALSWLWGLGKVETVAVCGTDVNSPEVTEERIAKAQEYGINLCKTF